MGQRINLRLSIRHESIRTILRKKGLTGLTSFVEIRVNENRRRVMRSGQLALRASGVLAQFVVNALPKGQQLLECEGDTVK